MMRAVSALTIACSIAAACGGSSTAPTPTSTATWNLTGTVSSAVGGLLNGAIVIVVDGPNVGRQVLTDVSGRYTFTALKQAGFTLSASAPGFTTVAKPVTLTSSNVTIDFLLPRIAIAVLTGEGDLAFMVRADGSYDVQASVVNTGSDGGCAGSVAGVTTITGTSGLVLTFSWALPATTIIRPGERASYLFGPITRANLTGLGNTGSYLTAFTFTTVTCP